VSHGPGPRPLAELSSDAATCSSAPDLTSLPTWALALPRVPWLKNLPPREESSGAATCSSASDLAFLSRWAPVRPRGLGLTSPRGELRCCHEPHSPQRAVDHGNKERPSCPRYAAGLACIQNTVVCYRGVCKVCRHAATVRFNSATQAQLPLLDMATVVIRPDRTTPWDGSGSVQQSDKTRRLHATDAVQDNICYS
jgi:hypothetical protein